MYQQLRSTPYRNVIIQVEEGIKKSSKENNEIVKEEQNINEKERGK